MFWAEPRDSLTKSFTYLEREGKKARGVIYRLFMAIAMTTGKKMQQFSTIQSEVNVFRVFAFFSLICPRTLHAIFEMSNSFDTLECMEKVAFYSHFETKKRGKINSVDVIYNLLFYSLSQMQRTKQRNSSTMVVSTSFDVMHTWCRIAFGHNNKMMRPNCFFATASRCVRAHVTASLCDNSIVFSKQSKYIDISVALCDRHNVQEWQPESQKEESKS